MPPAHSRVLLRLPAALVWAAPPLLLASAGSGAHAGPDIPGRGLILRLDASVRGALTVREGAVCAWRSTAPGAPTALTALGSSRPLYVDRRGRGRPVIRFDGRNDVLHGRLGRRSVPTWTLAVVAAPAGDGRGGGLCCACPRGGDDYDPGFTVDLYRSHGVFDQLSVEGAGRIGGQQDQMRSVYPAGGLHVVVVERDVQQVRLRIDGAAEGTRPAQQSATLLEEFRAGARHYGGREREYLRGDIAAVVLYSRILSVGERARLEAALRVGAAERRAGEEEARMAVEAHRRDRMSAPVVLQSWPTIAAFEAAKGARPPAGPIERLPVRRDVREALALAVGHLNSLFDRDRDGEPFFYANCRADGTGVMLHSVNIGVPHVVGRALLGSMLAERLAGIPCPPEGLAILERYLRASFDNTDHLNSYIDPARGGGRYVEFHNMREGLYGLVMLIQGRGSPWARETAGLMLRTLDALTDERGEWSVERARALGMADRCEGLSPMNAARMVDPLVACYRVTGDSLALKLAGLYARAGLRAGFLPDGRFAPMARSSGHIHSITSSLSGITEYALMTGDAAMAAACRRIVDRGVLEYFSSWGWGDEVMPEHPADERSRGEINQTGDVIRTALLLGGAGYPEYFELAERYLRSMLLPTQHRETELRRFLHDSPAPKDDSERNVLLRTAGGFAMQLPNDRMQEGDWPLSTLDITSGAAHALAECWRSRLTVEASECRLNLLLDVDAPEYLIRSALPLEGRIDFVCRTEKTLLVRIPLWVRRGSLRLRVNREERPVALEHGYARVAGLRPGDQGALTFDVPCRIERERVDGVTYRTTWVGNQLVAITPRGRVSPLPF